MLYCPSSLLLSTIRKCQPECSTHFDTFHGDQGLCGCEFLLCQQPLRPWQRLGTDVQQKDYMSCVRVLQQHQQACHLRHLAGGRAILEPTGRVQWYSGIEFEDFNLGFHQSTFKWLCTSLKYTESHLNSGIPPSNVGFTEAQNPFNLSLVLDPPPP